jgi:hypothetical protein
MLQVYMGTVTPEVDDIRHIRQRSPGVFDVVVVSYWRRPAFR